MSNKDQSNVESATAQTYFTRLLEQIDAASARGRPVAVLDRTVPIGVVAPAFHPANRLSYTLPVFRPGCRNRPTPCVDVRRHSRRIAGANAIRRTSGMSIGLPVADVVAGSGAKSTADHGTGGVGRCATSSRPGGTIDVRLVSPLTPSDEAWLLVGLTSSSGAPLTVSTLNGGETTLVGTIDPVTSSTSHDYVLPLSQGTFDTAELSAATAGQHVCISSIDAGTFSAS